MATIRTAIQIQDGMSQAFRAINVAMQSTINNFEHLQQTSGNAVDTKSIENARRELARTESAFNEIEQQIREADNAQKQFNNDIRDGSNATDGLLSKIGAIIAAYLSIRTLGTMLNMSDQIANTSARLDIMNDGLQTTAELQDKILASANRTYSSYNDTADMVSKLGILARDAFSSNDEIVAFAEILNKHFVISGTSAEGMSAAMLQLTQAMAAGALRGEELNSIFEQAPTLIQNIADHLQVSTGEIKEMASKGKITADVVKRAMFSMADETNARFESMPNTFQDIWNVVLNNVSAEFGDFFAKLNSISDSVKFKEAIVDIANSFSILADIATRAIDILISSTSFIYDNWSIIGPVVMGVVGALGFFITYIAALKVAIMVVTAAHWAWNAAMMANPIGLIIAGIILLIGLFYAAVGALNHFAGTSISATGIITGTFMVLDAFLHNIIAGWWNLFASLVEFWANVWTQPTYSIKRLFANLANTALDMATSMIGNFDSAATNFANLFIDAANKAISAINWVSEAINNLTGIDFGTIGAFEQRHSLVADYSGLKNKINDWVGDTPEGYWEAPKMEMKNLGKAWDTGYNWGANLFGGDARESKGVGNEDLPWDDILSSLGNVSDSPANKDTAKNTAKMAKSMDGTANELKYLRDIAERESINRYTTAEIKVDMKNENHINSEMDIDGIIDRFGEKVEETIAVLAEGDSDDV